MKKTLIIILALFLLTVVSSCADNSEELENLNKQLNDSKAQVEQKEAEFKELQSKYDDTKKKLQDLEEKYNEYRASMKKFEGITDEDLKVIQKEQLAKEERIRKAAEEELKKGYNTGITYKQLARTPDKYKDKKIKFTGRVVQVIEGDGEIQLRLATKKSYDDYMDDIILCAYEANIVKERVLEDDIITIYGVSGGLISYESTMGGKITIPGVVVQKIERKK